MQRRKNVTPGAVNGLVILGIASALRGTNGSSSTLSYSFTSSVNTVDYPNCNGTNFFIGDGDCDAVNNNVDCGYDGGDCCRCTCVSTSSYRCGNRGFDCLDPAAGEYILGCEVVQAGPPAVSPCVAGTPRHWIVNTTASANLLAGSTLCSGGVFEVEWKGHVSVNRTLYAIHGTVLDVVGASDAVADGGGATQLFAVFNGSLHVSSLQMSDGAGIHGGAISATQRSNVTLTRVNFSSNIADGYGGAIHLDNSLLQLADSATFTGNNAIYGGAIYITGSSFAQRVGSGEIYRFIDNSATDGGALYMSDSTSSSGNTWPHLLSTDSYSYSTSSYIYGSGADKFPTSGATFAKTYFINNSVDSSGGAIYIDEGSSWIWVGEITLNSNSAAHGGALFMEDGVSIEWQGVARFSQNWAREDGGAVASGIDVSVGGLYMYGGVSFSNNSCGGSGGAMALSGAIDLYFGDSAPEFSGNVAAVFGGAIYTAEATHGHQFVNVRFTENHAQNGGAVFAAGCGTAQTTFSSDQPILHPTNFSNCIFVENSAQVAGGAIEIAIGRANVEDTVFVGNVASVGGALKLFCTAGLFNSSFYDNVSGEGGGSAISGVGSMLEMMGLKFAANRYKCSTTEFLDFIKVSLHIFKNVCHPMASRWNDNFGVMRGNTRFAAICQGCDGPCQGCMMQENTSAPNCTDLFSHASSNGGTTTIAGVLIDPEYWRSDNQSTNVLPCYNPEACRGGLTDDPGYCRLGYKGPYCSVCIEGYAATLAFTCSKCSGGNVAVVVVLLAIALLATLAVVRHLVSGEHEDATRGVVVRMGKVLPLQSIKIIIVAWQIITQFSSVAHVIYPEIYQRLLDVVSLVNFDIGWILSAGCIMDTDFHDSLLVATIGPIVLIALLGVTYTVATKKHRGSQGALRAIRRKHAGAVVLLTFFVYSSVSSAVFRTFACDELDDRNVYLRADYRIECDSPRHKSFRIYAGFMILVYPVGVPLFYTILLFQEHKTLAQGSGDGIPGYLSTSTLRKPYRPAVFYYEVVECSRRILLTGVVVFIYPNTGAQIAVTTAIAFTFVLISEGLRPYASRWDSWVSRTGHLIVFLSMYVALLLRVDVANESHHDQNIFAGILVAAHVIMIMLVIVETMALLYSMRSQERLLPVSRGTIATSGRCFDGPACANVIEPYVFNRQHKFRNLD